MLKIINKMDKIHTSELGGDDIYVIKYRSGSRRKNLMFIILEKSGEYSAPIFKNFDKAQYEDLNFLKYYGISITEKDIKLISKYLIENWEDITELKSRDTLSIRETFKEIYNYYLKNITINNRNAFIKDGYFNILSTDFNSLIETCGYSPLYFKKILKENEMIRTNSMRPYDFNIKTKLENHWYISINICDLENEADFLSEKQEVI